MTNFSINTRVSYLKGIFSRTAQSVLTFENNLMRNILEMSDQDRAAVDTTMLLSLVQDLKTAVNVVSVKLNAISRDLRPGSDTRPSGDSDMPV